LNRHHLDVAIAGFEERTSCASNTTGNRKYFLNARPHNVILPGPFLDEEALKQAIASFEARAEAAERNGLPKTAKSWRDAVDNLRAGVAMQRIGANVLKAICYQ
jgi:hypothetical protein